jgi:hypothetical protein
VFEGDDDIWATEKALIDVVDQIAPRTLAGAVAKLRVIIWNENLELDRDPSLRQVMEFLERAVDAGGRP